MNLEIIDNADLPTRFSLRWYDGKGDRKDELTGKREGENSGNSAILTTLAAGQRRLVGLPFIWPPYKPANARSKLSQSHQTNLRRFLSAVKNSKRARAVA